MTTHNPTPEPGSPSSGSAGFPPAPWILLDRTTATQTATVLDRLAQWLAGAGEPDAVAACAAACSLEEDDELSVAAWLDALAGRLDPPNRGNRLLGSRVMVVTAPTPPTLPEELAALLRRMRLPCCAAPPLGSSPPPGRSAGIPRERRRL